MHIPKYFSSYLTILLLSFFFRSQNSSPQNILSFLHHISKAFFSFSRSQNTWPQIFLFNAIFLSFFFLSFFLASRSQNTSLQKISRLFFPGLKIQVPKTFLFDVIIPKLFLQVSKYKSHKYFSLMPYFETFFPGLKIKVPKYFSFLSYFQAFFFQVSKYTSPNTSLFYVIF